MLDLSEARLFANFFPCVLPDLNVFLFDLILNNYSSQVLLGIHHTMLGAKGRQK